MTVAWTVMRWRLLLSWLRVVVGSTGVFVVKGEFLQVTDEGYEGQDGKVRERADIAVLCGDEVVKIQARSVTVARAIVGARKRHDPIELAVTVSGAWPKGAARPFPAVVRLAAEG